ncbi:unnamed protein product, partial [marine sediment metagenome]
KKIILLSERLIEGVEEEGLNLARLYIPGLSRYYIKRLVREGYADEKCLRGLREEELAKVLPERLVKRIQKRIKEDKDDQEAKKQKLIAKDKKLENCHPKLETCNLSPEILPSLLKTKNSKLKTVLQIDQHRPDRIIFLGKKIEVTSTEFSLIYFLAQHNNQVMSYDTLLDELWKDEKDVIYRRVNYHVFNIKKAILKTIGETKTNIERIKKILVVVPGRGIMLNLMDNELIINRQHAPAPAS